ncbi:hypothetical protein EYD00_22550 [Agrobacterium sp. 33MFTa1.1]|nr:hypothetical protein EYD00_22550 [Agrobacterium sp. 33MFTa1.1]
MLGAVGVLKGEPVNSRRTGGCLDDALHKMLSPLDLCQGCKPLSRVDSSGNRLFRFQCGKYQVRIMNVMVAGFFGFIVLRLKPEGFMGKTDV